MDTDGWDAYRCFALTNVRARNPHPRGSEAAAGWTVGWLEASMADAIILMKTNMWKEEPEP